MGHHRGECGHQWRYQQGVWVNAGALGIDAEHDAADLQAGFFLAFGEPKTRKGRSARAEAIFGGVPDRVLRAQACKSAEQQVVVELLKQHPLALTYLFLLSHSTVLSTINRHGLPSNPASSWRNQKNRNACYLFRCTQSPPRDGGAHTFINLRLVFQTACPNPPREER